MGDPTETDPVGPPMAAEVDGARAVVLVEGDSDRVALETLAARRGRDLVADGVRIVAIGGATAIGTFLHRYGPHGADLRVAGLCDAGEERGYRRRLERAGLGGGAIADRAAMEALGFFVCDADLEDELLRALGPDRAARLLAEHGDLDAFVTFSRQPAQRERAQLARLRRFLGTMSGRKIRYGRYLVEALDLDHVPRPLDAVLARV